MTLSDREQARVELNCGVKKLVKAVTLIPFKNFGILFSDANCKPLSISPDSRGLLLFHSHHRSHLHLLVLAAESIHRVNAFPSLDMVRIAFPRRSQLLQQLLKGCCAQTDIHGRPVRYILHGVSNDRAEDLRHHPLVNIQHPALLRLLGR
jgi:hypothetical protein